jgi:hypothetical protein
MIPVNEENFCRGVSSLFLDKKGGKLEKKK